MRCGWQFLLERCRIAVDACKAPVVNAVLEQRLNRSRGTVFQRPMCDSAHLRHVSARIDRRESRIRTIAPSPNQFAFGHHETTLDKAKLCGYVSLSIGRTCTDCSLSAILCESSRLPWHGCCKDADAIDLVKAVELMPIKMASIALCRPERMADDFAFPKTPKGAL